MTIDLLDTSRYQETLAMTPEEIAALPTIRMDCYENRELKWESKAARVWVERWKKAGALQGHWKVIYFQVSLPENACWLTTHVQTWLEPEGGLMPVCGSIRVYGAERALFEAMLGCLAHRGAKQVAEVLIRALQDALEDHSLGHTVDLVRLSHSIRQARNEIGKGKGNE